jgi:DNA-binding GntR family transcriptional regulator
MAISSIQAISYRRRKFCIHFLDVQSSFYMQIEPSTATAHLKYCYAHEIDDSPGRRAADEARRQWRRGLASRRDPVAEGARVPERQLCELFGISRTPLREALKVLAAEGLIDLLPNRGARVRRLSRRDLDELFDMMGGLESLAGRLACETITDDEIAEIEQLHYEMYGYYLHRDMHNYFQANQRIHEKIVDASRSETLRTTYANFAGRIRRVRYSANFARKRQRWAEAMREHEAILDALRRRAGSELSDILFHHLRAKRMAALEHLDGVGDGSAPAEASGGTAAPNVNS